MSSAIDDTTLSSTAIQPRRDSLEKHLQTRPELQDLKDRHILLDTSAAPYVLFFLSWFIIDFRSAILNYVVFKLTIIVTGASKLPKPSLHATGHLTI
jgi:hypothetical protein